MLLCGNCGEVRREERGVFKCSCDELSWPKVGRVKGTETEETDLAKHGFHFVEKDAFGDIYYLGPQSHIIHLLENNQWESSKAPDHFYYMQEYLAWIDSKLRVS
jgi:hypothetical protein